jgi:hypothetical protein
MTTAVGHPLNRVVSFKITNDAVQNTIDDQHCFQRKTPFRQRQAFKKEARISLRCLQENTNAEKVAREEPEQRSVLCWLVEGRLHSARTNMLPTVSRVRINSGTETSQSCLRRA